ncbi:MULTISPECIES: hypothetical protein [Prevotellaceae]|nr:MULTISPECIES: hypothetical protein [Prevotellaceae]EPH15932.1 hypothetical protein HMPREF1475_02185 [Hoylesella oralis HGA0225]ETD16910.1 hypothetical protein HMPREF1199_01945 [Hoylesella oralis CC98A]SHF90782.1 hypothetical protein SAMN05444288_1842 [Hoylesella oralis]
MINDHSSSHTPYTVNSLEELRMRKDTLRSDIQKDEEQIKSLWSDLFRKSDDIWGATPSKRIAGLLSTGASVIDGALLGWKLYRRFNIDRLFGRRRR